ncbi:MAG: hypothetical protein OXE85_10720 [Roseovarius sp.]|nr:hypothetical protein [Roseovarius sp.]
MHFFDKPFSADGALAPNGSIHGERRFNMDLGGFDPLVSQPESDQRPIDTDLHEVHCRDAPPAS